MVFRVPPESWMNRFRLTGALPATACSALVTCSSIPRSVVLAPDNCTQSRSFCTVTALQPGPSEARRTVSSAALLIFWRMRAEVQRPNYSDWSREV
jgi:hypothetical protein